MKGLILCAGKGTRLQPLSYSQPKTLLPVANKPVLIYCINQLLKLGIIDIGIVINKSQEKKIKEKVGNGERLGAKLTYIYQSQPRGIAHALKQTEQFIDKDPFVLLLGDNLIQESLSSLKLSLEKDKVSGSIMLAKVTKPQDYGIAEINGDRIVRLEEKPQDPKSKLAVIGVYAFDSSIFRAVNSISPSLRGEYEITDSIQWLIDHKYSISYSVTEKHYSDVGTVERWLEANRWMLDEVTDNGSIISENSHIENCTLIHPIIIGEGCRLKDSTIGPYVSMASGTIIDQCQIENCIILENVDLHLIPYKVKNSVFGCHTQVKGLLQEWNSFEFVLGDKSSVIIHGVK